MDKIYTKEELLDMYRNLKFGRLFTLKMHETVYKGLIRSSFHTPYGQEAIGVGVVSAMRKTDWLAYTHRFQTGMIMRYDPYGFIADLFGLYDGIKNGTAFDYHLADLNETGKHILFILGTLGGTIPMNTGFAWARKMQGKDDVCVVVHGDGGCSEGAAYEGWNLAALHKTPNVYVIVNNGWAMTVPLRRESAVEDISAKAAACGLPAQVADGNNILKVRRVMEQALEMARNGQPNVVEFKTLRWEAHFVGQGNDYRDDKEKIQASMEDDDCVKNFERTLLAQGVLDQAYIDQFTAESQQHLDEMVERAAQSRKSTYDEIYTMEHLYATPETGGKL